jgi:hypothetical protein
MSACAMLTYNKVNLAAWQAIKQAVAKYHVQITADSGSDGAEGFTVSWNYSAATEVLSLQCTGRPFFISCSTVNSTINDEVEACLNQHQIQMTQMIAP